MAGFWSGLVHGTLMCGATLAALSLGFPREAPLAPDPAGDAPAARTGEGVHPGRADGAEGPGQGLALPSDPAAPEAAFSLPEAQPAPLSLAEPRPSDGPDSGLSDVADGSPAAEGTVGPAASPLDAQGTVDDAPPTAVSVPTQELPVPVGSEFKRGADEPPLAPADSAAPLPAAAPSVPAVGKEASPQETAIPGDPLPEPVSPPALAAASPLPDAISTPQVEAPIPVAPPGRVVVPPLDRLPERDGADTPDRAESPAEAAPVAGTPGPAPAGQGTGGEAAGLNAGPLQGLAAETAAPAPADAAPPTSVRAPRPAPDLSLPRLPMAPVPDAAAPASRPAEG